MTEKTKEPVPDLMANLEESLTPEAPAEKRTQGPQTYVVQMRETLPDADTGAERWRDVATVTVPPRTTRKTVVTKALMQAGIAPDPGKPAPRVRVLDEESAFVHEPEAKQPPAEWVIG